MNLDAAFFPALNALGNAAGVDPAWFLTALYLESRLQTNPAGNASYAGLSQISNAYLASYGLTRAEYVALPASEQVTRVISPWYLATIQNYLGHAPRSPGVLYALNLAPGVVKTKGDAASVVLYASPSPNYSSNSGLDVTHDGAITISDLDVFMQGLTTQPDYQAALAELRSYQAAPASAASSGWKTALVAGSVLLLGAGVAAAIDPKLLDLVLPRR